MLALEARTFPAPTFSTHFFRGDGLVPSLAELGVLDAVLDTGAPRLVCEYRRRRRRRLFPSDGGWPAWR